MKKTTRTLSEITNLIEEVKASYMDAKYGEDRETPARKVLATLSKEELSMYWKSRDCINVSLESRKYMLESILDAFDWEYQQRALRG
jgi:hypothetical protein